MTCDYNPNRMLIGLADVKRFIEDSTGTEWEVLKASQGDRDIYYEFGRDNHIAEVNFDRLLQKLEIQIRNVK